MAVPFARARGMLRGVFSPSGVFKSFVIWPLKSDKVENLTFLLTFDTEEKVARRGHHDDFW